MIFKSVNLFVATLSNERAYHFSSSFKISFLFSEFLNYFFFSSSFRFESNSNGIEIFLAIDLIANECHKNESKLCFWMNSRCHTRNEYHNFFEETKDSEWCDSVQLTTAAVATLIYLAPVRVTSSHLLQFDSLFKWNGPIKTRKILLFNWKESEKKVLFELKKQSSACVSVIPVKRKAQNDQKWSPCAHISNEQIDRRKKTHADWAVSQIEQSGEMVAMNGF